MRQRIASLTSRVLNPFVIGAASILILSFEAAAGAAEALRWAALMTSVSLLPVFVAIVYLVRNGHLEGMLQASRRQRTVLYLLSIACAGGGYAALIYTGAPELLRGAFAGGAAGAILFSTINLRWKISLHTGVVGALTAILIMLYGPAGISATAPAALVGWSRLELGQHTPAQAIAGGVLASAVVVAAFRLFGLP